MPQLPQIRQADNGLEIFDIVRKRYVALTPEEDVRQAVIRFLHGKKGYPLELIQVEGTITLNGMTKRCDIVVYGKGMKAKVIVECKRPKVALTQKVLDQACRYNTVLQVPYLVLSNGEQMLVLKITDTKTIEPLSTLPDWEQLKNS